MLHTPGKTVATVCKLLKWRVNECANRYSFSKPNSCVSKHLKPSQLLFENRETALFVDS